MTSQMVDLTLDCKGLSCPIPIIRTKKTIGEIGPGQVLEVLATDPGSVADVKSWATRTGHQFVGTTKDGDVFKHYIRRADPDEVKPEKTHPNTVSNEELQKKLKNKLLILDVREPMEYYFEHIPGAKLVSLGQLEEQIESFRDWSEQEVHAVYRTGNRSDVACQILTDKGFQRVLNVTPGMSEWSGEVEASQ